MLQLLRRVQAKDCTEQWPAYRAPDDLLGRMQCILRDARSSNHLLT